MEFIRNAADNRLSVMFCILWVLLCWANVVKAAGGQLTSTAPSRNLGATNTVELEYEFKANAVFSLSSTRFSTIDRSDPSAQLEVMFAIKQNNVAHMKTLLDEISYPNHPSGLYGKFLNREEIAALSANPDGTARVMSFLQSVDGISQIEATPYGEYIKATASISTWEYVFNASYQRYSGTSLFSPFHAVRGYCLPSTIANDVSTVLNTIQGPVTAARRSFQKHWDRSATGGMTKVAALSTIPDAEIMEITPEVLNALYDITSNNGSMLGTQAVFETKNESYSMSDLSQFQALFNLPRQHPSTDIDGHTIEGSCVNGFNNCGEANLDVQYLMGMSQDVPTTYWYDPEGLTSFLFTLCSATNPPFVISVSYLEDENNVDSSTADSFDTEAVKLGLMGVSLIMASGDGGVAGEYVTTAPENCGYNPAWPLTSPYVTGVGGTQGYPEVVCSSGSKAIITSGGGFSNLYPTASFQIEDVAQYFDIATTAFQNTSAPHGYFNASGRGFPDIAAEAAFYAIIINGSETYAAGTSASTPVFAAMVALVNSARISAGKAPLGWLNPSLYMYADLFVNDITVGNNSCMEVDDLSAPVVCCREGYFAAVGWDPTTGLGTVNFTKFMSVMMELPDAYMPTMQPTDYPTTLPTYTEPSTSPTTHHVSKTGKYFGIACACFLVSVGLFTCVWNMEALKTLCCGTSTKPLAASAEGTEMQA
jgi:tripeptidyl-peptidase-1